MKSKQVKFLLLVVAIIIVVVGIGFVANKAKGPSKYDEFAKALSSNGAVFYGAFWCPHCQAVKALFGSSKQYLPYVECSNPDNTPTQACLDKKVESYPTWTFKDGITLTSEGEPTICQPKPGVDGEAPICKQVASQYYKTWIFPGAQFSIKSPTDPVKKGSVWKFDSSAAAQGETPLEFLASQIGYTLPQ